MSTAARSLEARRGYDASVLIELDEKLVSDGGQEFTLLALWDPKTNRTFVRWTPAGQDLLGPLLEVEPAKLGNVLKHPTIFLPIR